MPAKLTEKLSTQLEDMRRNVGSTPEQWAEVMGKFTEEQQATLADGFLGRAQNSRQYQEMQDTLKAQTEANNRKLEAELTNLATMKNQVTQQLSLRTDGGDEKAQKVYDKARLKIAELAAKHFLPIEDLEFRIDDIAATQPNGNGNNGGYNQQPAVQSLTMDQINELLAKQRTEVATEVEAKMTGLFNGVTKLREDFFDQWGERLDIDKVQQYMVRNNVDGQTAINDIYDIPRREREKKDKEVEDWRNVEREKIRAEEAAKYATSSIGAPNLSRENLPAVFGLLAGQLTETTSSTNGNDSTIKSPVATSRNDLVREIASEARARGL